MIGNRRTGLSEDRQRIDVTFGEAGEGEVASAEGPQQGQALVSGSAGR